MKFNRNILLVLLSCTFLFGFSQTVPTWDFARSIGGTSVDEGAAVCVDANNNIIVVGKTLSNTLTVGSSTYANSGFADIVIAKYDALGNLTWFKLIGGTRIDEAYAVTTDTNNNIFVTGQFNSGTITVGTATMVNTLPLIFDAFVIKLDPSGTVLWAKNIGGSSDDVSNAIAMDSNNNFFITGYFISSSLVIGTTTLTSPGGGQYFIAKFDNNGNPLWAQQNVPASGIGAQGRTIVCDAMDNVIAGGIFTATITIGTNTFVNVGPALSTDGFVAKYDNTGSFIWAKSFTGPGYEYVTSIKADASDLVVLGNCGGSSLTINSTTLVNTYASNIFYLTKLNAAGNVLWIKQGSPSYGYGLAVHNSSVAIAGTFGSSLTIGANTLTGSSPTGLDAFIAKYNSAGNEIWAISGGTNSGDEHAYGLATSTLGEPIITGDYNTSTAFGTNSLTGNGNTELFVAKIKEVNVTGFINVYQKDQTMIYPNPCRDHFTIKSSNENTILKNVIILNNIGQKLIEFKNLPANSEIPISSLSKGVYFVKLEFDNENQTYKIIKD